jgi:hypothetical protein
LFWNLPGIWRLENRGQGRGFEFSGPSRVSFNFESNLALDLSHETVPVSRTYGGATEAATRIRVAGSGPPSTVVTIIAW